MRVKTQYYLQPSVSDAHSVVIEDHFGHILFVAIEVDGGNIVTAVAGDKDFDAILKAFGIENTTTVKEIKPKSLEQMKKLL
jgi:hypothetical protein